jgi:hypothetical protein
MQFVIVFHILAHGCPMTDFESLKDLFQLLKVKSISRKHWINGNVWGMEKIMCCKPNLGLATKIRGCKVVGQERNPRVTSHAPRSAKSVKE